jgi:hypothetical protein
MLLRKEAVLPVVLPHFFLQKELNKLNKASIKLSCLFSYLIYTQCMHFFVFSMKLMSCFLF